MHWFPYQNYAALCLQLA